MSNKNLIILATNFTTMTRDEVLKELKKYFKIQELVDEPTYKKWKDNAWNFFSTDLLETLLVLRRDILQVPLVINDWSFKGSHQNRGLRSNLSYLVKDKTDKGVLYLSQHCMGKAIDAVSSKMTAEKMRNLILKNQNLLPCNIRVEGGVSWLHFDIMDMGVKVYIFKS